MADNKRNNELLNKTKRNIQLLQELQDTESRPLEDRKKEIVDEVLTSLPEETEIEVRKYLDGDFERAQKFINDEYLLSLESEFDMDDVYLCLIEKRGEELIYSYLKYKLYESVASVFGRLNYLRHRGNNDNFFSEE